MKKTDVPENIIERLKNNIDAIYETTSDNVNELIEDNRYNNRPLPHSAADCPKARRLRLQPL